MAKPAADRVVNDIDQHLNRGMTLVELVVTITILGLVGSFASAFVVISLESYLDTQTQTIHAAAIKVALQQMAMELSSAMPPTVVIDAVPARLQFDQILTAGVADVLWEGRFRDSDNPSFTDIKAGMRLLFWPRIINSNEVIVQSVNTNSFIVSANAIQRHFPKKYWVIHRSLQYSLQNGQLFMGIQAYGESESSMNQHLLCENVRDFQVCWNLSDMLALTIVGEDPNTDRVIRESKVVTLRWGN